MFTALITFSFILFVTGGAVLCGNIEGKKKLKAILIGCALLVLGTFVFGLCGTYYEITNNVTLHF